MTLDKRLLPLARSARHWIALAVLLGWLIVGLNVLQIALIGRGIDRAYEDGARLALLGGLLLAFAAVIVVRAMFNWLASLAAHHAAARIKIALRDRLYTHLLKLGPFIGEKERSGALVNTAGSGVEDLEVYFGLYLPQLVLGQTIPLLLIVYVATIDPLTALALLISLPLVPLSMMLIQRRLRAVSGRYWRTANRLSAQFLDSLQGLTTLKMFNRSHAQGDAIHVESEVLRRDTMRLLAVNQSSLFFIDWVATLGTTVVTCGLAAVRLDAGAITFGEAVALALLSVELGRPLRLLGAAYHAGAAGVAAAQHVFDVLAMEPPVAEKENAITPAACKPHLRFEGVHFAYDGGARPALDGITFEVQPGETVALVGPSGAGKSTLFHLLFRFFDPQTGTITLGDYPLPDLALDWLHAQLALVSQDTYLFYGTLAQNLRLAKPDATLAELEAAARAAQIHDFMASLPDGYETQVGERGLTLSGGQAQRIAIARAMLKDAPIILLDEATSHVDAENESAIQAALNCLTAHKTVLVIAHRLNTVRHADRILVIDAGRVVEAGTHDVLLRQQGVYAQLVSAQVAPTEDNAEVRA